MPAFLKLIPVPEQPFSSSKARILNSNKIIKVAKLKALFGGLFYVQDVRYSAKRQEAGAHMYMGWADRFLLLQNPHFHHPWWSYSARRQGCRCAHVQEVGDRGTRFRSYRNSIVGAESCSAMRLANTPGWKAVRCNKFAFKQPCKRIFCIVFKPGLCRT